jgi:CAAX protease family protein
VAERVAHRGGAALRRLWQTRDVADCSRNLFIAPSVTPSRGWTLAGLGIALFAAPLIPALFRFALGPAGSSSAYVTREIALFLCLGVLLWIIASRERLPLTSIGLQREKVGRSLLWGLIGTVLCAIGLAACLGILYYFGVPFGGDSKTPFSAPLWATLITVVRAAVVEEVFYRGYAIERIRLLTGSTPLAVLLPLLIFAGAHYRQGVGGILIALVTGGILSALFVKRRDLAAVITTHFIVDFIPNILLPLLSD